MGQRILVVDDAAEVRDLLSRLLGRHYEVQLATDGEQAMRAIRESPPDLVLLDVKMPGKDGMETLWEISMTAPDLPVCMISSDVRMDTIERAAYAGADDFLLKPFRTEKLLDSVRRALDS